MPPKSSGTQQLKPPPSPEDFAFSKLLSYVCYQWPRYRIGDHHKLIAKKLEAVERGESTRLMITVPPRHGKSMLASEYFPAWYLGRNPEKYIIAASYNQEFADGFGRKVRNQLLDPVFHDIFPDCRLMADSTSAKAFNTTKGGSYYAVGIGGPLTGRGADLLLIDDPIKNHEEAQSDLIRQKMKDWYASTAYTRLMPNAAIVLIQTRWHNDDLGGWLQKEHAQEGWEIIDLPAINDKGEALWPSQFPVKRLHEIRDAIGPTNWSALYQQTPIVEGGGILKRKWWKTWKQKVWDATEAKEKLDLPLCDMVIQVYDTAFKEKQENDFTARLTCGIFTLTDKEGRETVNLIILEIMNKRLNFPELRAEAERSYKDYEPDRVLIEDKASGQSLLQELRAKGIRVTPMKADKSPMLRAHAASVALESGAVWVPEGLPNVEALITQCELFPNDKHDDMVTVLCHAVTYLRQRYKMVLRNDYRDEDDLDGLNDDSGVPCYGNL